MRKPETDRAPAGLGTESSLVTVKLLISNPEEGAKKKRRGSKKTGGLWLEDTGLSGKGENSMRRMLGRNQDDSKRVSSGKDASGG